MACHKHHLAVLLLALVLVAGGSSTALGQMVYGQPAQGGLHLVYSNWSIGDTSLNQVTVPLTGFVPLKDNLELQFYVASSSNSLDAGNGDLSLGGLGDLRLQVSQSLADDQLLLSLGLNLPTGKKELNATEEIQVLQELSQNYLNLPMRRFGEGFGFTLLVGGARTLGSIQAGAGIMYRYNGSYKPYEGRGDYDPGDVFSINAGIETGRDDVTFTADAIITLYGKDTEDGQESFKQSSRIALQSAVVYDFGGYDWSSYMAYVIRGRNELAAADDVKLYGNEFQIGTSLYWDFKGNWYAQPSLDLRLIAGNDMIGSSSLVGLGTGLGYQLSERVSLDGDFKYFVGGVDDGDVDISGLQLGVGLAASL